MKKTFAYIISALTLLVPQVVNSQARYSDAIPDSVTIPLSISVGVDVANPIIHLFDGDILTLEAVASADINEKLRGFVRAGYADYSHSSTFYSFDTKGLFSKFGIDINLLKPEIGNGMYWAGIGLAYGMSLYSTNTPYLESTNYWGTHSSSFTTKNNLGHFLEICPGFEAELFKSVRIGWRVSLKKILYSGTNKDYKPTWMPGYGQGTKGVTFGVNYFITWNIPYKKIRVKVKEEKQDDASDESEESTTPNNNSTDSFGGFGF